MLYKIDYSKRSGSNGTKWLNYADDKTDAVKRFMDWFFADNPGDAVRIDAVTSVEFTGDMSSIDLIDAELAKKEREG